MPLTTKSRRSRLLLNFFCLFVLFVTPFPPLKLILQLPPSLSLSVSIFAIATVTLAQQQHPLSFGDQPDR